MAQQTVNWERSDISPEQVQAEIENVLRSTAFERTERLQRFLRFICEMTLKGESHRINEYLIGSDVFQRGPNYSPGEDSIVRRQAHALRQKLQDYYSTEGRDHEVRIELPVGRYVPVFRRMLPVEPKVDEPKVEPRQATAARRAVLTIVAAIAIFVIGFLTAMALPRAILDGPKGGPATRAIWEPWLATKSDAVICFTNPMTAVIKRFDEPLPEAALPKRFRATSNEEALFRETFRLPPGGYFYYTPVTNQTKVGEAVAGVHLTSMLTRLGLQTRSTQSRFLSWEDLRRDNLIILGHNEANKWLDPLLKDRPFNLQSTTGHHPRGIVNAQPAAGELPVYQIAYSEGENDADREYALVSMLPGIERGHPLLIISGLNAQATQIATEYMTSEARLAELLQRLKQIKPDHRGPWHFQVILRTEVYDKVPTKATLVALRVL